MSQAQAGQLLATALFPAVAPPAQARLDLQVLKLTGEAAAGARQLELAGADLHAERDRAATLTARVERKVRLGRVDVYVDGLLRKRRQRRVSCRGWLLDALQACLLGLGIKAVNDASHH